MKFSKNSEKLMISTMNDFSNFLKKRTTNRAFNNFLKDFYKEILESDKFIKKEWVAKKVKITIKEVHKFSDAKHGSLINSSYLPEPIKLYIKENIKGYILYETTTLGRKIKIYLYLMDNTQFNKLEDFDILVHKMLTWLKVASKYSKNKCSQTLDIYCYLTPHQKILPNSQLTTLSPHHVNSAVTTSCSRNGEICIFRIEELFKVFIHETFHNLGLDFSTSPTDALNAQMKELFPINSEFNLYESYTEFWASIMNCLFTAFYLTDDKENIEVFILYAEYCINYERFFSLFQCVKVLNFMGLKYIHLFKNDKISKKSRLLYKEETNVFSYYIVKTILLYNNYEFLKWCKNNNENIIAFNQTEKNMTQFFNFVLKYSNNSNFLKYIKKMEDLLKSIKLSKRRLLKNTMRMTIIETV
jgi:hypothetical protein